MTFSTVVRDSEFQVVGVLRLRYYAQILQRFVARDTALLGPGAFLTLVDQQGRYLAHGLEARVVGQSVALDSPELSRGLGELDNVPMFTTHLSLEAYGGGREQKVAGSKLQRKPWRVAVVRPSAAFMAPVEDQLLSAGLVALAVGRVCGASGGLLRHAGGGADFAADRERRARGPRRFGSPREDFRTA